MSLIQTFALFEKHLSNVVLYHGSPFLFEKFKDKMTFFSDNSKFAYDYADEKSMDNGYDESPIIYECLVNAQIFDAKNETHLNKLISKLPETITCYMTNFCFPHDFTKDELIPLLKGEGVEKPNKSIVNAKIGDEVPDPEYNPDKLLVINRDNEYVYTIDLKNFGYELRGASSFDYGHFGFKYRKIFNEFRDYVKPIMKRQKGHIGDDQMIGLFFYKKYHQVYGLDITDEEYNKGEELFNSAKAELIKVYGEEYQQKWVINPKPYAMSDTWRFYENDVVANAIKELGYCGYVALEKGHNTYAIFNPNKSVTVSCIYYHGFKFNDKADVDKFHDLNNELYRKLKVSSFDFNVYKMYKQGLSNDDIIHALEKQ